MKNRKEKPGSQPCEAVESLLSDAVVLRSLRRRLWGALQNEDVDTAIKVYTASRLEYLEWLAKEEEQSENERRACEERKARRKKEKRGVKPVALKKFGVVMQSTRQSLKAIECYSKQQDIENDRRGTWKRMDEPAPLSTGGGSMLLSEQLEVARIHKVSPTSESQVGLLQQHMNPSEPFNEDDQKHFSDTYTSVEAGSPECNPVPRKVRVRSIAQPRLAGFFGRFGGSGNKHETVDYSHGDDVSDDERSLVNTAMTTPLHEASRMGSSSLVRLMLSQGADPNLKNGQMRTALHMAAGGLTQEEETLLLSKYYHVKQLVKTGESELLDSTENKQKPLGPGVGIRKGDPQSDESEESRSSGDQSVHVGAKKAVHVIGRFFKKMGKATERNELQVENEALAPPVPPMPDLSRLNELSTDRVDAVMALLLWSHPDDGGSRALEGPSVNSVDSNGRTALHYAAELGRSEICMTVLNSFDAILTIVDDSGQTPCELAGEQTHSLLASQLEARALLCSDPYGMEDVLMDTVIEDSKREAMKKDTTVDETNSKTQTNNDKRSIVLNHIMKNHIVQPFDWFETWNLQEVRVERKFRVTAAFNIMKRILDDRQLNRQLNDLLFSHSDLNDAIEESVTENDKGSCCVATHADDANVDVSTAELFKDSHEVKHAPDRDDQGETATTLATRSSVEEKEDQKLGNATERCKWALSNEDSSCEPRNDEALSGTCTAQEYGKESQKPDPEIWAAVLPNGIETDERFTIGLDGRDIHVRCPPNVRPGQTIRFIIEAEPSDASGDTKIMLVDSEPRQDVAVEESGVDKASQKVYPIHESHVERLLAFHRWHAQSAVSAFKDNPEKSLREAGITVDLDSDDSSRKAPSGDHQSKMCLICFSEIAAEAPEWTNLRCCKHGFCSGCLANYIADTSQSKACGVCIVCPHHECSSYLDPYEVECLAPDPSVFYSLVRAADENFVTAADDFRFCPHPGCDCVVRCIVGKYTSTEPSSTGYAMTFAGAVCRQESYTDTASEDIPYTYEGVRERRYLSMELCQPKRAHRFCFHCGEDAHWPAPCDTVHSWTARIEKEIGTVQNDGLETENNIDEVAQRLWMKANTRPCPQCKAPIEKNDGCNHMTCSNRHCRHEFCWICRKDWKLHNTETGGFFRCNRWQTEEDHQFYDESTGQQASENQRVIRDFSLDEADSSANQTYGSANHAAKTAWKKSKIMARFLHHFRRWTAHSESAALEQNMADTVSTRLAPVAKAALQIDGSEDFDFGGKGMSFVHAAFIELLECRKNLQYSYAFAFFQFPAFYYSHQLNEMRLIEGQKLRFETVQSELEMVTEQLSDVVARSHLRATQTQIMCLTKAAAEKRREFFVVLLTFLSKDAGPLARAQSNPSNSSTTMLVKSHSNSSDSDGIVQDADYDRFEDDALQRALQISMQTFTDQAEPTHDLNDVATVDDDEWNSWPCSMCTYMNAGGGFCAMCGTTRG